MPLQNRGTPFGTLEATPARGAWMGNRGNLHDVAGKIVRDHRPSYRAWVICALSFRGRHRRPMLQPNRYTELFFLDEATALAAGHRPCGQCRHADYRAFMAAAAAALGITAPTPREKIDDRLHAERSDGRHLRRGWPCEAGALPDGTMIRSPTEPTRAALWRDGHLRPWSHDGYGKATPLAGGHAVEVLTPATTVAAMHQGFRPQLHPSASAA